MHTFWTLLTVRSQICHSLIHRHRNVAELQVQPPRVLCRAGDHNHALWRLRHAMEQKRSRAGSTASFFGASECADEHGRLTVAACGTCTPVEQQGIADRGTGRRTPAIMLTHAAARQPAAGYAMHLVSFHETAGRMLRLLQGPRPQWLWEATLQAASDTLASISVR